MYFKNFLYVFTFIVSINTFVLGLKRSYKDHNFGDSTEHHCHPIRYASPKAKHYLRGLKQSLINKRNSVRALRSVNVSPSRLVIDVASCACTYESNVR